MVKGSQLRRAANQDFAKSIFLEKYLDHVVANGSKVINGLRYENSNLRKTMLAVRWQLEFGSKQVVPHLSLYIPIDEVSSRKWQDIKETGIVCAFFELIANKRPSPLTLHLCDTVRNNSVL